MTAPDPAGTEPRNQATAGLELVDTAIDGPEATALIDEVQQEYVVIYGGPDRTPMLSSEFAAPAGAFLLVVRDGVTVGCAGLRRHDEQTAELKRMYVRPAYRRQGLARLLLDAVEERARRLGYRQLILETGVLQPQAMALYASHGYRSAETFGHQRDSPHSRAFLKTL